MAALVPVAPPPSNHAMRPRGRNVLRDAYLSPFHAVGYSGDRSNDPKPKTAKPRPMARLYCMRLHKPTHLQCNATPETDPRCPRGHAKPASVSVCVEGPLYGIAPAS
eukprot:2646895-Pyramimonas_sp.AAC.1